MGKLILDAGWERYERAIDPKRFSDEMRGEIRKATEMNAIDMRRVIRRYIQQRRYLANAPLTLNLKRGSKPLVGADSTLFGSVTYDMASDFEAFVGIKRGARDKRGEDMVDVGIIIHEGTTIPVTEKMRNLFKFISREQKKQAQIKTRRAKRAAAKKGTEAEKKTKKKSKTSPKRKKKKKPESKKPEGRAQFLLRMARGRPIKEFSPKTKAIVIPPRPFIRKPFQDGKFRKRALSRWTEASQGAIRP